MKLTEFILVAASEVIWGSYICPVVFIIFMGWIYWQEYGPPGKALEEKNKRKKEWEEDKRQTVLKKEGREALADYDYNKMIMKKRDVTERNYRIQTTVAIIIFIILLILVMSS